MLYSQHNRAQLFLTVHKVQNEPKLQHDNQKRRPPLLRSLISPLQDPLRPLRQPSLPLPDSFRTFRSKNSLQGVALERKIIVALYI